MHNAYVTNNNQQRVFSKSVHDFNPNWSQQRCNTTIDNYRKRSKVVLSSIQQQQIKKLLNQQGNDQKLSQNLGNDHLNSLMLDIDQSQLQKKLLSNTDLEFYKLQYLKSNNFSSKDCSKLPTSLQQQQNLKRQLMFDKGNIQDYLRNLQHQIQFNNKIINEKLLHRSADKPKAVKQQIFQDSSLNFYNYNNMNLATQNLIMHDQLYKQNHKIMQARYLNQLQKEIQMQDNIEYFNDVANFSDKQQCLPQQQIYYNTISTNFSTNPNNSVQQTNFIDNFSNSYIQQSQNCNSICKESQQQELPPQQLTLSCNSQNNSKSSAIAKNSQKIKHLYQLQFSNMAQLKKKFQSQYLDNLLENIIIKLNVPDNQKLQIYNNIIYGMHQDSKLPQQGFNNNNKRNSYSIEFSSAQQNSRELPLNNYKSVEISQLLQGKQPVKINRFATLNSSNQTTHKQKVETRKISSQIRCNSLPSNQF